MHDTSTAPQGVSYTKQVNGRTPAHSASPYQTKVGTPDGCTLKTRKDDRAQADPLAPGKHPGFKHLKPKPGVYRCLLRRVRHKANANHGDYVGILRLANCQAWVVIWIHKDGTLGLRLEKLERKIRAKSSRHEHVGVCFTNV